MHLQFQYAWHCIVAGHMCDSHLTDMLFYSGFQASYSSQASDLASFMLPCCMLAVPHSHDEPHKMSLTVVCLQYDHYFWEDA